MPTQTGGKRRVRRRSSTKSRKRSTKKRSRSVSRKRKTVRRSTSTGRTKLNKWQRFLKKMKGRGMTQRQLRTEYRRNYM